MFKPPGDCPVCGTEVRRGAKACPECGADERSGWKDDDAEDGLDLPGEKFDYDEFIAQEFGTKKSKTSLTPIWWITAVILLGLIVLGLLWSGVNA